MGKYIARQPIFDAKKIVYGYELLFRDGAENFFSGISPDAASTSALDSMLLFGLERLIGTRRAFVNCSRQLLVGDYITLLPKDRVVVEVLETLSPEPDLLKACRRLKEAGYLIALDDFIDAPDSRPFLELADIVKVDVLNTSLAEQDRLVRELRRKGIRMLAEKIEDHATFRQCVSLGFSYFQGYFFRRPEMLSRHDIPAYEVNYLRILHAVNRPELDLHDVTQQIKHEASLSYRLLRYLNSAAFALSTEIGSIPHALSLLGESGIRKWISLVAVAAMSEDKAPELITVPLIRARFCELIAPKAGMDRCANDLFLMGLLSGMDAVLDMRMAEILEEVKVKDVIENALLGGPGLSATFSRSC